MTSSNHKRIVPIILKVEMAKDNKAKAVKTATAVKKGNFVGFHKKIHTSVHFRRPKTLELKRSPKYVRHALVHANKMDEYAVIRHPLTTESAMACMEKNNTLSFIVDVRANKNHIKQAFKKLYDVKPVKVNTLIRPDGQKKAFIKLPADVEALEVANKINII